MKKIIIYVSLILTIQKAIGQNFKNRTFIGLNAFSFLQFQPQKTKLQSTGTPNETNTRTLNLIAIPQFGYKLKEDKRLGIALGYQRDQLKEKITTGSGSPDPQYIFNRSNTYFIRGFFIKDFNISNRLKPFLQANIDYIREREIRESYNSTSFSTYSQRAYYLKPNVLLGIKTKIKNNLDIELTYGSIGYLTGVLITDAGGIDTKYDFNKFDINFTANTVTFGVKYYFTNVDN